MKKQEILKVIRDERRVHEAWSDQEKTIADAINLDGLIEPLNYDESDLYTWLKSNKSSISAFDWYKELEQVHVQAHYSYSDLFENATRKYNPKTRDELLKEFELVQTDIETFNAKLNQIESSINEMSDSVYLDFILKSNAATRKSEEGQESQEKQEIQDKQEKSNELNNSSTKENTTHLAKPSEVNDENAEALESNNLESNVNQAKEQFDSKNSEDNSSAEINVVAETKTIDDEMTTIDIVDFDDKDIKNNNENSEAKPEVDKETIKQELPKAEVQIDSTKLASDYQLLKTGLNSKDTLNRHITLKEQNINRLIKEKELSEQELSHLEDIHNISLKSLDQLEQHLQLKQEENELEQLDSEKLLETNTIERDEVKATLEKIELEKETLKNEIVDLEQENIKDELVQEEYKKSPPIDKQFDTLKTAKVSEVEDLQKQLSNKNSDLMQLKQQVAALENEVHNLEEEIELKQQGITDLENEEKTKNNELSLKLENTTKLIKERKETIISSNEKLEKLDAESAQSQKTLDDLNLKFEKMKQTIFSMADVNANEIDEIKVQQESKQNKLTDIVKQKNNKEEEIKVIQNRLEEAEKTLDQLKSELTESKEQQLEPAT